MFILVFVLYQVPCANIPPEICKYYLLTFGIPVSDCQEAIIYRDIRYHNILIIIYYLFIFYNSCINENLKLLHCKPWFKNNGKNRKEPFFSYFFHSWNSNDNVYSYITIILIIVIINIILILISYLVYPSEFNMFMVTGILGMWIYIFCIGLKYGYKRIKQWYSGRNTDQIQENLVQENMGENIQQNIQENIQENRIPLEGTFTIDSDSEDSSDQIDLNTDQDIYNQRLRSEQANSELK